MQPLLTDGELEAYAHHAKYDMAVLERHGYEMTNLGFETMIAAYLLGETSMRLKDLAFTRLGREMTEIVALIGSGRNQLTMDMVDSDEAGDYACADVEVTFELADLLRPEIHEAGMDALLYEIEQPLVPVLAKMEQAGIAVDVPYLTELSQEITTRLQQVEIELNEVAGRQINPNSARQLAPLLFEELGLPSGRRTKTGFSVDSEVLENLRHRHPIVDLILEYRTLAKLKSTYVDACRCRSTPAPEGSTRRSTRRSPRPVASRPPTRTCRTSRFAPSWAGACGARSSPIAPGVQALR